MNGVRMLAASAAALALALSGCTASSPAPSHTRTTSPPAIGKAAGGPADSVVPRFAHIVVVVEENRGYSEIIGNPDAPYINGLVGSGAQLTRMYAIRHPSEPNYLALFSGSTQGLTDDSCPHQFQGRNLGSQLRAHGQRFAGYAESLPSGGYLGCSAGPYARKHAPWTNFPNLPRSVGKPMSSFPSDFRRLPRVAFVVPNLDHDMHDGTIAQGDAWLRRHLRGYLRWARHHNSLLIVTWDEDDGSASNHIATVLAGAHVRQARYRSPADLYTLLRTIEAACGLAGLGRAARRASIGRIWKP